MGIRGPSRGEQTIELMQYFDSKTKHCKQYTVQ